MIGFSDFQMSRSSLKSIQHSCSMHAVTLNQYSLSNMYMYLHVHGTLVEPSIRDTFGNALIEEMTSFQG